MPVYHYETRHTRWFAFLFISFVFNDIEITKEPRLPILPLPPTLIRLDQTSLGSNLYDTTALPRMTRNIYSA